MYDHEFYERTFEASSWKERILYEWYLQGWTFEWDKREIEVCRESAEQEVRKAREANRSRERLYERLL
jgi:hypothetical protein